MPILVAFFLWWSGMLFEMINLKLTVRLDIDAFNLFNRKDKVVLHPFTKPPETPTFWLHKLYNSSYLHICYIYTVYFLIYSTLTFFFSFLPLYHLVALIKQTMKLSLITVQYYDMNASVCHYETLIVTMLWMYSKCF